MLVRLMVLASLASLAACASTPKKADRESIRSTIVDNKGEIEDCYIQALEQTPKLNGKLVTKWQIGKSGAPQNVGVKRSELQNPKLEACVVGKLQAMRFPEPENGQVIEVTYPFNFTN